MTDCSQQSTATFATLPPHTASQVGTAGKMVERPSNLLLYKAEQTAVITSVVQKPSNLVKVIDSYIPGFCRKMELCSLQDS